MWDVKLRYFNFFEVVVVFEKKFFNSFKFKCDEYYDEKVYLYKYVYLCCNFVFLVLFVVKR